MLSLFLSACESTRLYQWGGYEEKLHRYYSAPQSRTNIIQNMEQHVLNLEAKSLPVAPGLYAEIGTFYLEMGDELRAVDFYKKEAAAWPESQALMQLLIKNLESRTVKEEASDAS